MKIYDIKYLILGYVRLESHKTGYVKYFEGDAIDIPVEILDREIHYISVVDNVIVIRF